MNTKLATLVGICVSLWSAATLFGDEPTTRPSPERVKAVRAMYQKLPCEILQFAEPAKVVPGMWADFNGEAITMTLVDSTKRQFSIQLENSTKALSMSNLTRRAVLGMSADAAKNGDGVQITGINAGSPAEAAGLKIGDILVKLDDKPVKKERLFVLFDGWKPGDKVAMTIDRNGTPQVIHATFGAGGGGPFDPMVHLPSRGPEEAAIYGLLLRLSRDDQKAIEPFLDVLDEHFAGAMPK